MTCPHPATSRLPRENLVHPIRWVPEGASALLDVGCHGGAFLSYCRNLWPDLELAGVEIDASALEAARRLVPDADLRRVGAEDLPFPEASFDCVNCVEVLEHIPAALRRRALEEMYRVLRPGGRLVLRVPHAGLFAWIDPSNFRHQFPSLYRLLIGRGLRDRAYDDNAAEVVWHHHFTLDELLDLLGDGWRLETVRHGGLLIFPLTDYLRVPLYRLRRADGMLGRALAWTADRDLGIDYGRASYDILVILSKAGPKRADSSPSPAPDRPAEPG